MRVILSEAIRDGIAQVSRTALGKLSSVSAVAGILLAGVLVCQPEAEGQQRVKQKRQVDPSRCELQRFRKNATFLAEAWAIPDHKFNVGEPLRLQMRASATTYLNLFHVSTSCKVTRVVYNQAMAAGEIVDVPTRGVQVTVKPPPGNEGFYFVATRAELNMFAQADILRGDEIAILDMTPEEFFVRLDQASRRVNPADLSIFTLRTAVVQHSDHCFGCWPRRLDANRGDSLRGGKPCS